MSDEIYEFYDNGKVIESLDMRDYQCSGISGKQPINEACGGCVGCLLAQALHAGWHDFEHETLDGINYVRMNYIEIIKE